MSLCDAMCMLCHDLRTVCHSQAHAPDQPFHLRRYVCAPSFCTFHLHHPNNHTHQQSPEALERNQLAWLAFGGGPRTCIGYKFALNEVKTVLVTLWQHYDFEVDTAKTAVPPLMRPGITLGYREGLYCRVLPRTAA